MSLKVTVKHIKTEDKGIIPAITLYWDNYQLGCIMWVVRYAVIDNEIKGEYCIGGYYVDTSRRDKYPKVPHDVIIDLFNRYIGNDENNVYTINIKEELESKGYDVSVLNNE